MDELQKDASGQPGDRPPDEGMPLNAAEFTEILDHLSHALYAVDARWRITHVNHAAEALWDRHRHELLGKNIWDVFPRSVGTEAYHEYHTAMQERRSVTFEYFSPLDRRWYDVHGFPYGSGLAVSFEDISERKQVTTELEASKRLFERIAETSPDTLFVYDFASGQEVYVSTRNEQVLGYAADEVRALGNRFATTYWHPSDVPTLDAQRHALHGLADGEIHEIEYRVRQPDGTYRWLRSRCTPFTRGDDGQVRQIVGVTQNVSAHKEAEAALRKSDARFRRYFELGLIGMAITAPTAAILEANEQLCMMLGYERSELLHLTWQELTHPKDLAADIAQFNRVMAGEVDGYTLEKRWLRKDGEVLDSTIAVKCLRSENGSVEYFVALVQDITARKRAEEAVLRAHDGLEARVVERTHELAATNAALRESEARYRTLVDHFPNGAIFLFDHELHFTLASGMGLSVHNLAAGQFIGHTLRDVFGREIAERDEPDLRAALAGQTTRKEVPFGASTFVVHTLPIRDEQGSISGGMVMTQDVTARRRAEQEHEQLLHRLVTSQEEERSRIARELHDSLGQYLAALHLGIHRIQRREDVPVAVVAELQELRELAMTIDRTLDRLTFVLRQPALDDLGLEEALRLLVDEWSSTSHVPVDVYTEGIDHDRVPPAIETTVYRVVQEALTNVLKYAMATQVSVIVKRRSGALQAIIEDNGRGFDREALTNVVGGRQLGLLGMEERATLVRGRLDIETAPGHGTTVYLSVPLPTEAAEE